MEVALKDLYATHVGKVSDKWSMYLSEYDHIFAWHQRKPVKLLEIGIQNGGSLEIWSKFFAQAEVLVGCDIDARCAQLIYNDPRIHVVVGDANINEVEDRVLTHTCVFDIIIDDGSHRSSDIIKSFARYFPRLAADGIFIVEDLHCSYWQEWEGGLDAPLSSISFFKKLIDIINFEHWGNSKQRTDVLHHFFKKYDVTIDQFTLESIHSIQFTNSICVIRKKNPDLNVLGRRCIAGVIAAIKAPHPAEHGSMHLAPYQRTNYKIW